MVLAIYVWSGLLFKPRNFAKVSGEIAQKGLPFSSAFLVAAMVLEVFGSAALLAPTAWIPDWLRMFIIGAFIFYTLVAAAMFHPFWKMEGVDRVHQTANSLKNIGLMGAFILVALSRATP
jgi:uncharacterized membrane protein YphA (DoxX/SURF4 family)